MEVVAFHEWTSEVQLDCRVACIAVGAPLIGKGGCGWYKGQIVQRIEAASFVCNPVDQPSQGTSIKFC
jgi:hypothetical protein